MEIADSVSFLWIHSLHSLKMSNKHIWTKKELMSFQIYMIPMIFWTFFVHTISQQCWMLLTEKTLTYFQIYIYVCVCFIEESMFWSDMRVKKWQICHILGTPLTLKIHWCCTWTEKMYTLNAMQVTLNLRVCQLHKCKSNVLQLGLWKYLAILMRVELNLNHQT